MRGRIPAYPSPSVLRDPDADLKSVLRSTTQARPKAAPDLDSMTNRPDASTGQCYNMVIAAMSAARGGNIRVGIEDSLWAGARKPAESNAQEVRMARQIVEGLGLEIATPNEAREILKLKGTDKVAF
jgi:uncharacterized protein (DUF849 family)